MRDAGDAGEGGIDIEAAMLELQRLGATRAEDPDGHDEKAREIVTSFGPGVVRDMDKLYFISAQKAGASDGLDPPGNG